MSKHRLRKPPPPRRFYAPQSAELQNFGALGGTVSLTMAGLACLGCIWGVPVIARSAPPDLFAAPVPGVPLAQRPIPGLLPGSGAGLRTVLDGWLDVPHRLNAGVASEPEVLKAALSGPLDLSVVTPAPVGRWIGGRWVPSDHVVRPPCPSPVLDPAGFVAWWQKWFPGHPIPTPPVTTPSASPPVVTPPATTPVTPPAAPPAADPAPAPVETAPAPTAPAEPQPQPVVDVGPVVVNPPSADPPAIDPPAVVIDTPSDPIPPVVIDVPPVDPPPLVVDPSPVTDPITDALPPVDVSPVTDPVVDALPDPVGDVVSGPVDDVASVLTTPDLEPAPVAANATDPAGTFNSSTDDARKDAKTEVAESAVPLSAAAPLSITPSSSAPHSTSGNGESYVGKHRVENGGHLYRARGEDRRSDGQGRGASSRGFHRVSEAGSSREDGSDHGKRGGKHRSDRVSESKHESKSHKSDSHSKSHSSSKSHSGGGKSHSSHGGGHGGGHGGR